MFPIGWGIYNFVQGYDGLRDVFERGGVEDGEDLVLGEC